MERVRAERLPGRLILVLLLAWSGAARAAETIVVRVVLNEIPKGELFAVLEDDGGVLLKAEDLTALGLVPADRPVRTVDGETWVALGEAAGITFRLEMATLTLHLVATPSSFPPSTLDLLPKRRLGAIRTRDRSAFFNYRLDYTGDAGLRLRNLSFGQELGVRLGDWLLHGEGRWERTDERDRWLRLSTSLTRDDRERLTRFVAGDFVGTSGLLGSALGLGGVSFSRAFRIDPYLVTRPAFEFTGSALTPSQVDVYLDGQKIATQAFPPGTFSLRNIVGYTGARTLEVVIRDVAGREERFLVPFYFSDVGLSRGLTDFSYSIGAPRREFGQSSFDYGSLTFLGFHRWGVTDHLTLGARAEANGDVVNAGPDVAAVLGQWGTLTAAANVSASRGAQPGWAGALSWVYGGRAVGGRLYVRSFSSSYATVDEANPSGRTRVETGVGLNASSPRLGSLAFDLARRARFDGPSESTVSATLFRRVWKSAHLRVSGRWTSGETSRRELFVGLTAYLGREATVSAGTRSENGRESLAVEGLRGAPLGEGIGYGLSARLPLESGGETQGSANVQVKRRFGLFRAGVDLSDSPGVPRSETYRLSAAGGLAWAGGTVRLTRPITDSFGVVRVGGLKGIRVSQNGQVVGRTDDTGVVLLPELASYLENQVSIENRDIPLDYSVPVLTKVVSPPIRSGSALSFDLQRVQGVTGTIFTRRASGIAPIEFAVFTLETGSGPAEHTTGSGGEFYLENLPPGRYQGHARPDGRHCTFTLEVPVSTEFIFEAPPLVCEPNR